MTQALPPTVKSQKEVVKWRLMTQASHERAALAERLQSWRSAKDSDAMIVAALGLLHQGRQRSSTTVNWPCLFISLWPLIKTAWPNLNPWSWNSWVSHAKLQWQMWKTSEAKPPQQPPSVSPEPPPSGDHDHAQ